MIEAGQKVSKIITTRLMGGHDLTKECHLNSIYLEYLIEKHVLILIFAKSGRAFFYFWDFFPTLLYIRYEIKHGKHIDFKPKDKQRFTRAKTIGEDYTKERLRERIINNQTIKTPSVKKRIGNVININTTIKVKERKGYEYWATKHNLHTMAESIIYIREHGIKFVKQLDEYIQKAADERQNIQEKIKAIDKEMQMFSTTMEKVHTFKKYRTCYKEYKANPSDKAFFEEYKVQITLYENALS